MSASSRQEAYALFSTVSDGTSAVQKLTIEPGTWINTGDTQVEGKPAKVRFTLANMSPAGGAWKYEVSVAGGPWAVMWARASTQGLSRRARHHGIWTTTGGRVVESDEEKPGVILDFDDAGDLVSLEIPRRLAPRERSQTRRLPNLEL